MVVTDTKGIPASMIGRLAPPVSNPDPKPGPLTAQTRSAYLRKKGTPYNPQAANTVKTGEYK